MTGITAIEVAGRVGKFTSKSVLQLTWQGSLLKEMGYYMQNT